LGKEYLGGDMPLESNEESDVFYRKEDYGSMQPWSDLRRKCFSGVTTRPGAWVWDLAVYVRNVTLPASANMGRRHGPPWRPAVLMFSKRPEIMGFTLKLSNTAMRKGISLG